MTYVTDSEYPLTLAFEEEYPIEGSLKPNNHLHCFIHMNPDMKTQLSSEVSDEECTRIRNEILGFEYKGKRIKGLVDCADEEFEQAYSEKEANWPEKFKEWMLTNRGCKRSVKDTLRLCMLRSVHTRAGLGNPPTKVLPNEWNHCIML